MKGKPMKQRTLAVIAAAAIGAMGLIALANDGTSFEKNDDDGKSLYEQAIESDSPYADPEAAQAIDEALIGSKGDIQSAKLNSITQFDWMLIIARTCGRHYEAEVYETPHEIGVRLTDIGDNPNDPTCDEHGNPQDAVRIDLEDRWDGRTVVDLDTSDVIHVWGDTG